MADDSEDWITAREAVKLLKPVMGSEYEAQMAICERAHDKLISARAARLIVEDHSRKHSTTKEHDDVEVPRDFWWARGAQLLKQNWSTGDFETWINKEVQLRAYGVKFLRSSIMSMVPSETLERAANPQAKMQPKRGEKIFIGHGHSLVWRELKDFITERLNLPYDEFNAKSAAGISTIARLEEMLNNAAFAFLVFTAEDELADGEMQARMNVVHEAGLFAGHLG